MQAAKATSGKSMIPASTTRPLPIYVIHGKEDFLRVRALHEIVQNLLGNDRENMAYVEFDGPTARMADVLDECRTPSLLAPLRVVCVRQADVFLAYKAEDDDAESGGGGKGSRHRRPRSNREILEDYLESPSPTGVLILECGVWLKTTRLYKLVPRVGRTIACEPLKGMTLTKWVADQAAGAYRCQLEFMAAEGLVNLVGDSLGLLDSELAKLATFVAPRTLIRVEDVENLVGVSREEKVFKITDAVARRDAATALALWEQVLATDRDAPYRAVGGLAYGFRRLAEARRMMDQGMAAADAAKTLKPWMLRPSELPDLKRQICRFSARQWQDHLVQLLHIDVGTKSGLGTVRSSVEKLIVSLCVAS